MTIGWRLSLLLDAARLSAALIVFVYHASQIGALGDAQIVDNVGLASGARAHLAVVVFFVLSGFLIAHVVDKPSVTWRTFAVDRFGRLSSVVVPGLLLTALVMLLMWWCAPDMYGQLVPADLQWLRLLINSLYLQQIWFVCVVPGFNNPFWSLGYEFWYYVLFSVFTFWRRGAGRWLMLAGLALLVGPKVMLLFPTWMMGAFARQMVPRSRSHVNRVALLAVFAVAASLSLAGLLFAGAIPGWSHQIGQAPWYYSANYLVDTGFGCVLALALWAFASLDTANADTAFNGCSVVARAVSRAAAITFSLYLFHQPLLHLLAASGFTRADSTFSFVVALAITLLLTALLAHVTERKVRTWRGWVAIGLSWLERRVSRARLRVRRLERIHSTREVDT